MTDPTVTPPQAEPAPPAGGEPAARPSDRFFAWMSGLGVSRADGWLGGVCAGLAARLRIDPLLVRGILVVAALFALPVVFLYAAAWALLPDAEGRIHARDAVHGDFQPVQLGILAVAVIGLIPRTPFLGALLGMPWLLFGVGADWTPVSAFLFLCGLALIVVLLVLVVRAARRTPGAVAPDLRTASADPAAPAFSATSNDSGSAVVADGRGADAVMFAPSANQASAPADSTQAPAPASAGLTPPPAPDAPRATDAPPQPPNGSPADLDAWRAQHAAWREQDQAWRRAQQDAEKAARDQARRERQDESARFAAEAAERRRVRRLSKPRTSAAFVAAFLGLAVIVGAAMSLTGGVDGGLSAAIGLLSAALVLAVGMVVAGVVRRRSGFLAFVTVVTLIAGAITGGFSTLSDLAFGDRAYSNAAAVTANQPFGNTHISLSPQSGTAPEMRIAKGTGDTFVVVDSGVELRLRVTGTPSRVSWTRITEDGGFVASGELHGSTGAAGGISLEKTLTSGDATTPFVQPLSIDQRSGEISITLFEASKGAGE